MVKKFILRYIKNHGHDENFLKDVQVACHKAQQRIGSDKTVPNIICSVFIKCAEAITKVVPTYIFDDAAWRELIAAGIYASVRETFQLPKDRFADAAIVYAKKDPAYARTLYRNKNL